jgi:tRNA G18 (ribose-2'-O)-methylase SpoU
MRKLAVHELNRLSAEDYRSAEKRPVCVLLDNIRSANNVGSVFRTCDAFRIEKIWVTGFSARPPHKDIFKTALGASETVPWEYIENAADCVAQLRHQGYTICAVEQAEGAVPLQDMQWDAEKYAVVFGNEVNGVSEAVMEAADMAVEVPQWGTKHSLNVSVCAGVVLWDLVSTREGSK